MTKEQLEHIIRASAAITDTDEFIIIGSQAILASYSDPGPELTASYEADIFSPHDPGLADVIDGSIGENSAFYTTFGYYAHGVSEQTATLPEGWRDRLVVLRSPGTRGAIGRCLEVHDIAASKLAAGREKDLDYVAALFLRDLVDGDVVKTRVSTFDEPWRSMALERMKRLR